MLAPALVSYVGRCTLLPVDEGAAAPGAITAGPVGQQVAVPRSGNGIEEIGIVAAAQQRRPGWQQGCKVTLSQVAIRALVYLAGMLSIQVLTALGLGFDPIASFQAMLSNTARYNVVRNYWYSLFYTPYDVLLFAGIPAAALLVGRLLRLARLVLRRQALATIDWLLVVSVLAFGAMILTGVQKAENARVFLYLMPVVVFFAAAESKQVGIGWRAFMGLAALTLVQLIIFQAVLEAFL